MSTPGDPLDPSLPDAPPPGDDAPQDPPEPTPQSQGFDDGFDEDEEALLGGTDAGVAINAALRALARAARSFLLYDPHNEAIRKFLEEYRDTVTKALEYGPMELDIRPFDMVHHGEVVYLERDWERSLAFRCYRDGVRRLVVNPEVSWDELLRLLGILSVRYTGVRQQEDDIVTLLWKAGFQNIQTVAVEGFVPEEEDAGDDSGVQDNPETAALRRSASHIEVPGEWDLPAQPHAELAPVRYRPLTPDEIEAIRAETSSTVLPSHTVRLLREMLALVRDPADPTQLSDLLHYVSEVRSFLLSEGQVVMLLELVRELARNRDVDPDHIDMMLTDFTDAEAIRRVLHSVSSAATTVPEELVELLDLVPGDHLAILVKVLGVERAQASRRIARQLIERYVTTRMDYIEDQIATLDSAVAGDLLRAVAGASASLGVRLAHRIVHNTETDIQLQILRLLKEVNPTDVGLERLLAMLESPMQDIRLRVIEMIITLGDGAAYTPLHEHLENPSQGKLDLSEIIALGRALALLDADRAWGEFADIIRPQKFLNRVFAGGATQKTHRQWAGVAALGVLPRQDAEDAIRWLAKRAGEDLHQHCMKTLVRRRHEGVGDG